MCHRPGRHERPNPNPHTYRHGTGPLAVAARSYQLLMSGPDVLAIDGRVSHGLPHRSIPLPELEQWLTNHCCYEAHDEVWRHLVARARTDGPAWVVAAVGIAQPGLRAAAGAAARRSYLPADTRDDLDAELLAGFLEALRSDHVPDTRVRGWLIGQAYIAARRQRRIETRHAHRRHRTNPADIADVAEVVSLSYPADSDGPDTILNAAVARGVITAAERDLIARTRLNGMPLLELARSTGQHYDALASQRRRAEADLLLHLGAIPRQTWDDRARAIEARRQSACLARRAGQPRPYVRERDGATDARALARRSCRRTRP